MKISLVIPMLANHAGGAEYVVCSVASALAAAGHDVEILHYADNPGTPFYKVHPKVSYFNVRPQFAPYGGARRRLLRLAGLSPLGRLFPILRWIVTRGNEARWLKDYFSYYRPDIVVAFTGGCISNTSKACKSLGIPFIISIHNVPQKEFDDPTRWDPTAFDRRKRKEALYSASAITILSENFREYFEDKLKEKVYVIPNFVNEIEPDFGDAQSNANTSKRIISVGRLADVKQHELLLIAWSKIASIVPDWSITVYGDGPRKERLEGIIKALGLERSFILHPATTKIWDEYRSSAFTVHPAKFEGFGLVVLEAMHCGIPTIAFADCPGVNELIIDGETGVLITPEEDRADALAKAMLEMINQEDIRLAYGKAAMKRAQNYSSEKSLSIWTEMIENL